MTHRSDFWFKSKLKEIHPTVKALSKYIGTDNYVKFKCLKCYAVWYNKPINVIANRKTGCLKCRKQIRASKVYCRTTKQIFIKKLKEKLPNIKLIKGTFVSYHRHKAKFKCSSGHLFENVPKWLFYTKHGCAKCGRGVIGPSKNKITKKEFQIQISKIHNNTIKIVGKYLSQSIKCTFLCQICTYKWKSMPYSVKKGTGCPRCSLNKSLRSDKRLPKIVNISRRKVFVTGYEHFAIDFLKKEKFKMTKLFASSENKVPTFSYKFKGKIKRYFPDFFYLPTNTIIEVKSLFTSGINKSYIHSFSKLKRQRKKVISKGFNFELFIFDYKGKRILLPDDWYNKTRKQISDYLVLHQPQAQ